MMAELREPNEPKNRKRQRRLRLKKLNPFRKKYKPFSEEENSNKNDTELNKQKKKRKSPAKRWLNAAFGVLTFRSRRKRNRTSSNPLSARRRSRSRYSSTGSLQCLVTPVDRDVDLTGDDGRQQTYKGITRAHSDPCLYQASKDLVKKKSKKKRVRKASIRACKFVSGGIVQAAEILQYVSPMAAVPSIAGVSRQPYTMKTAASYHDNGRRYRNYSNMQYAFM